MVGCIQVKTEAIDWPSMISLGARARQQPLSKYAVRHRAHSEPVPGGRGAPVWHDPREMSIGDIDLVEINEAFAAQVIPSHRELGIDLARLNVHGGSIAVGHQYGMTGARITTTLMNGLRSRDATFGLETMCLGGGQGMAVIIERLN